MARAPRAQVSKTSGQGVSRLAYQRGYALKQGDAPKVKTEAGTKGEKREYSKGKSQKGDLPSGFNVSYGDTYEPTDLEDVLALHERGPPKGWSTERKPSKKLK